MKKLIVFILALLVTQTLTAQSTFSESTFRTMMADFAQNPVSWLTTKTAPGFTYIDNNGSVKNVEQTKGIFKNVKEFDRKFSDIKVSQNGDLATVTAKLDQHVELLGNGQKIKSKHAITYTFFNQKNKWLMTSAQHTSLASSSVFTLETWNDFNDQWNKDQLKTLTENSDPKLSFIDGKAEMKTLKDLVGFYTYYQETSRKYSDLSVNHSGKTAVVTGYLHHEWYLKKEPQKLASYDGAFTYTFAHDGGKWVLLACQHTDRKH